MPDFKIDFDVPIPDVARFGTPERYPFSKLTPGASFFVPCPDRKTRKSMYSTASSAAKRLGIRLIVRPMTETGPDGKPVEGVRIFYPAEQAGGQAGGQADKPKRGGRPKKATEPGA